MIGDFDTILNLVGPLDDGQGENTPRARFRTYLGTGLTELGSIRDAVQTCITNSGPQYARALQDLVNFLGSLMGFEVEYGRYAGVVGQVGHDGLWRSKDRVVVVEVKTTDAYAIKTDVLPNYINSLRSDGRITPDDQVIGLYVYAKFDPQVKQLEHAIIAEKRTQELRVGSVDAVLSLAELIRGEVISHDEALAILWPSGVWIDNTVGLLGRIAAAGPAQGQSATVGPAAGAASPAPATPTPPPAEGGGGGHHGPTLKATEAGTQHFLAPVGDIPDESARETIERLVGAGHWAVSDGTPNRTKIKPGDRMAFYQAGVGVVATATVASYAEDKPLPGLVKNPDKYRWTFDLKDVRLFLDSPIVIDAAMRAQLDEFQGRDPSKIWSWFVFTNRQVTEHDYLLLTGEG